MNNPNKFTKEDAQSIWEYLKDDQIKLIQSDKFICDLPKHKELQAIAVLLTEALREAKLVHLIPTLYFDVKDTKQPHQGVFRVPHYDLLTEHFKECGQCQTLTQHLTELVEWMID